MDEAVDELQAKLRALLLSSITLENVDKQRALELHNAALIDRMQTLEQHLLDRFDIRCVWRTTSGIPTS